MFEILSEKLGGIFRKLSEKDDIDKRPCAPLSRDSGKIDFPRGLKPVNSSHGFL